MGQPVYRPRIVIALLEEGAMERCRPPCALRPDATVVGHYVRDEDRYMLALQERADALTVCAWLLAIATTDRLAHHGESAPTVIDIAAAADGQLEVWHTADAALDAVPETAAIFRRGVAQLADTPDNVGLVYSQALFHAVRASTGIPLNTQNSVAGNLLAILRATAVAPFEYCGQRLRSRVVAADDDTLLDALRQYVGTATTEERREG